MGGKVQDPIYLYRQKLKKEKIITEDEFRKLNKKVQKEIDLSEKFARESKELDVSRVTEDIYA